MPDPGLGEGGAVCACGRKGCGERARRKVPASVQRPRERAGTLNVLRVGRG